MKTLNFLLIGGVCVTAAALPAEAKNSKISKQTRFWEKAVNVGVKTSQVAVNTTTGVVLAMAAQQIAARSGVSLNPSSLGMIAMAGNEMAKSITRKVFKEQLARLERPPAPKDRLLGKLANVCLAGVVGGAELGPVLTQWLGKLGAGFVDRQSRDDHTYQPTYGQAHQQRGTELDCMERAVAKILWLQKVDGLNKVKALPAPVTPSAEVKLLE